MALKPIALKDSLNQLLVSLLLIGLCVWLSFYKINCARTLPFFSGDGEGFYWTESAFHFRHVQMVAEGSGIPSLDTDIQYPEGLDTVRYTTPVMERVYGSVHRLFFPKVALHIFLIYFMSIFSTLSVVAVFLAGKFLWCSNWAGLISAFFYGVVPASFIRSAGGALIREDFALPFIFFSFACFIYCLRKDSLRVAATGSLLLAVGLAAWHLTQFYLLLFVVGFVITFFLQKTEAMPRRSFTVFTIVMVITALALPVLRAKHIVLSFPLMLSYGLLVVLWVLPYLGISNRKQKTIWAGLVILIFLAAGFVIQNYLGGHSYIYDFVVSKFRYLGSPPQDPSELPFEIKVTWTSSFVRPTLKEILFLLSSTLLFGVATVFRPIFRILKRKAGPAEIMTAFFALFTLLLFVMIHRLSVFAVFFLAIPIGYAASVRSRTAKILSYAGIGASAVFAVYSFTHLRLIPFRPPQGCIKDVIRFVKADTKQDEAVLTSFQLGPTIAAYARRPVILHSKFESKILRDKVKDVYTALYGSEDDFYQACKRYGAGLFVYQSGMVLGSRPGSIRYVAGAVPLKRDCAAALFHFAPEKLKHFHLVHQNFTYRIFRAVEHVPEKQADIIYEPVYDIGVYCDPESLGENISDSIIVSGLSKLQRPETHKILGDWFLSTGDFGTAALEYQRALVIYPRYAEAMWGLGKALYQAGQRQDAIAVLSQALDLASELDVNFIDIPDVKVLMVLGDNELAAGRYKQAEKLFREALRLEPESCELHLQLGTALFRQNKAEQAEMELQLAISCEPKSYQAYEILGKMYASYGEYGKAVEAVEMCLSLNPNRKHLVGVLKALRELASGSPEKSEDD